jgi:uncharacterized SAM-binding protein YcdF (DUF218 family)
MLALALLLFGWNTKVKKIGKIATIVLILFFSNTVILKEFIRLWEVPSVPLSSIENYDVAIVLGGMFEWDNSAERLSARGGADRLWQALNLYHQGRVKKILISGDSGYVTNRGLHESEQLKDVLVEWGYKEEDIITEPYSRNTYENAKESVRILKDDYPELNNYLLITSASHMRRAQGCFKKQGIEVGVFTTNQATGGKRYYHWDEYFVPRFDNFIYWFGLIKEWVGVLTYKVMGYL